MNDLGSPTPEEASGLSSTYWHWHGVPTFLRSPYRPDMGDTDVGLIGFPYSGGNAVERMQYLGPRAVRNRSSAYRRMHRAFQLDPFKNLRVSDLGDVPLPRILNPDDTAHDAEQFYRSVHERGIIPITVGGDHSITAPVLRAIAGERSRLKGPIAMIHFDAHADSFGPMAGSLNHAGAGFKIGVDEGLIDPKRSVQIGFHGPVAALQQDDWSIANYTVIGLQDCIDRGIDWVASEVHRVVGSSPAYLSLDLDVLDIAYAPGVADPEVNGMTSRELFSLLDKFRGINLVGADIACFCPPLDNPGQITALTASEILLQYVALIADYRNHHSAVANVAATAEA
jgi:guanidinopropionase